MVVHQRVPTFTAFISSLTPQEVRSSLFHREQLRAILALHGVPKPGGAPPLGGAEQGPLQKAMEKWIKKAGIGYSGSF